MVTTGKVLRFDEIRGYGFIAPDDGGEDVFMHANDLRSDKYLFQSGLRVEFDLETGDKGPKASDVRIIGDVPRDPLRPPASFVADPRPDPRGPSDDGMCDVLSAVEFRHELTEALIEVGGELTANQIAQVRRRIIQLAQAHNWVES